MSKRIFTIIVNLNLNVLLFVIPAQMITYIVMILVQHNIIPLQQMHTLMCIAQFTPDFIRISKKLKTILFVSSSPRIRQLPVSKGHFPWAVLLRGPSSVEMICSSVTYNMHGVYMQQNKHLKLYSIKRAFKCNLLRFRKM